MAFFVALSFGALLSQAGEPPSRAEGPTLGHADAEVVCAGELPFSQAEAQAAFRARSHLLGRASHVVVRGERGRALVEVDGARREVDLGGWAGEEAARLVAVLALDLAAPDGPTIAARAPTSAAPTAPTLRRVGGAGSLLVPWGQPGLLAHAEPTAELDAEVAFGLGPFVSAGYRRIEAGEGTAALRMDEIPIRAGVVARWQWFEARLGGTVRPHIVSGAGSYHGALWGGTASGSARWHLASRWALVFSAGVDVFRNRFVFAVGRDTVLSTAWL
ncbi:MAG TPA: hypothetical protein VIU64_08295, partial [Polyangia bacterium]